MGEMSSLAGQCWVQKELTIAAYGGRLYTECASYSTMGTKLKSIIQLQIALENY